MSHVTVACRELFENILFEMSSNAEIIEYQLNHFDDIDESFINNYRNRMASIVNAIDGNRHH